MAVEFVKKFKMEAIYWFARRLPACDEILPVISKQMDQPVSWKQRITVIMHNSICDLCKRYANQLLLLRRAAQKASDPDHPAVSDTGLSISARERLKRSLHQ